MKRETVQFYNECVAGIVERVVRSGPGPIRVPELAEGAGFSRFHLSRVFAQCMGESISGFVRRIQLERAAYQLLNTDLSIFEVSWLNGYSLPEGFCRAFKTAFLVAPTEFRRKRLAEWKLPNPTVIHWNPDLGGEGFEIRRAEINAQVVPIYPLRLALKRFVGRYIQLGEAWADLELSLGGPWRRPGARFFTVYHDDLWSFPDETQMRSDIGFSLADNERVPSGMREAHFPAGLYAVSMRYYDRPERQSAWSAMCGRWYPSQEIPTWSFDEYASWPVPWSEVKTRMFAGLGKPASALERVREDVCLAG